MKFQPSTLSVLLAILGGVAGQMLSLGPEGAVLGGKVVGHASTPCTEESAAGSSTTSGGGFLQHHSSSPGGSHSTGQANPPTASQVNSTANDPQPTSEANPPTAAQPSSTTNDPQPTSEANPSAAATSSGGGSLQHHTTSSHDPQPTGESNPPAAATSNGGGFLQHHTTSSDGPQPTGQATLPPASQPSTGHPAPTITHTSVGHGSPPATTAPPAVSIGGGIGGPGGGMTIDFINKMGQAIYVSYGNNAGGPGPVAEPTAGNMGQSTQVIMPTGWAGRVFVDTNPNVNPMGTKFEGSTTGAPDIDVSYVDGYSVPMTCSVDGVALVGCNIDLFAEGNCPTKVGNVCINPANTVIGNGPAPPFFAPCAGAAYTFPNDNDANVSNIKSNYVVCCIGSSCPAPARQGHMPNASSKRRLSSSNQLVRVRRSLHGGSLLARHHQHLHQAAAAAIQPMKM